METPRPTTKQVERLHSLAAHWEKELDVILEEQALGRNIDFTIAQIRNTYQDIIFLDFEYAVNQGIENKIWTKHHRIIERYRRNIHKLRETAGKKKPVELRKMVTNFVNFIKATTKFYRGFIQRLASHFGVCELEPVVEQFKLTISEPDEPISSSPEIKRLSIRSCHRCLVILGDLSRYRELASLTEKNWAPATGYYDLAKKLVPISGSPHNQLAVISASDGSNLSATYHLYRAVSVKEPFPESGNNLGLGFQKILKAYRSGKLGSNLVRKEEQQVSELLSLFTRLHAKYFNGKEAFELHESLQAEMLAQLTQDLKERLLSEGMLNKLVLINIAAEAYAAIRRTGREALQAVNNFLNLNVQTFNTLLLVFQPELERASVNRDKPTNPTEYVSAVGRRMLPALRLYSKWLLVSHEKLHNTLDDTALAVQTKQLWQTYANTLSLLAATFNVDTLPRLEYILEEDEDIIGFLPLSGALKVGENGEDIAEGSLLRHEKDAPYRVHPNEEQLSRVLLLLEDGLTLCGNPSVPIAVVDGTIIYQEDGMNTSILPSASPAGLDALSRPAGTDQVFTDMPSEMLPVPPQVERPVSLMVGHGGGSVGGSVAPSESASVMVAMNRMVDSIVGPRGGGETVSEEDEDDLREEEERTRHLERSKKQHDKESPIEEEEILFVGRKGRGGGTSKGFTSTVTVGKAGPGPNMGKKDITNTIVSTRATPPMGQRLASAISTSTRKRDLRGMGPSINSSGHVEYTHPINPPESRFETQLPEPSTLMSSSNPPSQVAPIGVTAAAITTSNSTPIQSTPPSITPAIPYQSSVPTGMGTYTASDLVKQLHSYSSQMNIASVSVTPSRSPQQSSTAHIQHPYTPQLPSPIGVKGHGGVGMGGDLWWSPGGGQPPPGVSNGGVYTEGETSLFMYGTGTGNNGGWGNTQSQSQGVGAGGGTGSPPLGYR